MKMWMGALLVIFGCSLLDSPEKPYPLYTMAPSVLVLELPVRNTLSYLVSGLYREIPVCLTGHVSGDTAVADGLYIPKIYSSTDSTTAYGGCDPFTTVATWHNHPVPEGYTALDMCYLSLEDAKTAIKIPTPFQVVQSHPNVYCSWSLPTIYKEMFARGVLW